MDKVFRVIVPIEARRPDGETKTLQIGETFVPRSVELIKPFLESGKVEPVEDPAEVQTALDDVTDRIMTSAVNAAQKIGVFHHSTVIDKLEIRITQTKEDVLSGRVSVQEYRQAVKEWLAVGTRQRGKKDE